MQHTYWTRPRPTLNKGKHDNFYLRFNFFKFFVRFALFQQQVFSPHID